ncbi:hypothetical protein BATDEDRAFT_90194 [Batrachochytrium dendrobatidis JAM81]|uniref:Uncharacterized protein n=1 Tax=Batrachochytrium dendrobatidis (strain JAM81 / FGSC 10211) TaxID=684364 RepID=F4P782_BATDJ|nr:uncharacterized protein BATDEDRAFT_90194 [Batrachochytrium dendrobatidis JAM81]EGF79036.1 hypothetical protein BATDEDRAFT_90194 [Batrachochytrium dendrobatidis JAM81]|eukprot:XP_006680549.1 hypothetical protein BATDEDRAFT_90194 [Batrachochytrium dendrobatidis JAM81]
MSSSSSSLISPSLRILSTLLRIAFALEALPLPFIVSMDRLSIVEGDPDKFPEYPLVMPDMSSLLDIPVTPCCCIELNLNPPRAAFPVTEAEGECVNLRKYDAVDTDRISGIYANLV